MSHLQRVDGSSPSSGFSERAEDSSDSSMPSPLSAMIQEEEQRPFDFQKLTEILNEVRNEVMLNVLEPPSPAQEDNMHRPRFTRQIFFDCDNTLVNTEAMAVEATATVVNKCLAEHNIKHRYSVEELIVSYFGCTARKMLDILQEVHGFKLSDAEIAAYTTFEEDLVIELIHTNPTPCSGIERVLEELHVNGKYILSVVSSSPIRRIRAALNAAEISQYFAYDQVFSAKSSLPQPKSKPDPAIYEFAMEQNTVLPWECIAFEDSRSGARSAVSAGIPCIAYVGAYSTPGHREQAAHSLMEEGCRAVMYNYTQFSGFLARIEGEIGREVVEGTLDKRAMQKKREEDFEIWLRRLVRENKILRTRWVSIKAKLDQKLKQYDFPNKE